MELDIGTKYLVNYVDEDEPELSYYGMATIVTIYPADKTMSSMTEYVCRTDNEPDEMFFEEDFICRWEDARHYEADVTVEFILPKTEEPNVAAVMMDERIYSVVQVGYAREAEDV
jgi:hypothetical protein